MDTISLDDLVQLEEAVWQALVDGDAFADEQMLSDDFAGVYATGFATRGEHAGQLRDGPTIATFELYESRILAISDTAAMLMYRADYRRATAAGHGDVEVMYVSSLWCHRDGRWVNVFSQDTPAATDRPS